MDLASIEGLATMAVGMPAKPLTGTKSDCLYAVL